MLRRFNLSPVFVKYCGVSLTALFVDVGLLFALREWFGIVAIAGMVSYLAGGLFHYAVSRRFVFAGRGQKRLQDIPGVEYLAWLCCSFAGVIMTALTLYIGADLLNLPLLGVKCVAVALSFFTVYFLQSRIVFPAAPANALSHPPPEKSPQTFWRWVVLSWMTLLIAVIGGLGEIGQNKELRAYMYDVNPTGAWLKARDMVASDKYSLSQWESPSPHYPELGVMALLYVLFDGDISLAMPLFALIQIVVCALGLALVFSLTGSRALALCGAPLAVAAQAILVSWGADDLFGIMYYSLVHYSNFALTLPCLYVFVLAAASCHRGRGDEWFWLAATVLSFAFMLTSDPILFSWLIAPAAGTAVVSRFFGRISGRTAVLLLAAVGASVLLFRTDIFSFTNTTMLHQRTTFNPADVPVSVGVAIKTFGGTIWRHPFLALLWMTVMVLLARCFLRQSDSPATKAKRGKKNKRFSRTGFLLAFFILASLSPLAPVFAGFFKDYTADVYGNWEPLRFYVPLIFYPLFFAVPLLVFVLSEEIKNRGWRLKIRAMRILADDLRAPVVLCVVVLAALSLPFAVAAPRAFSSYTTPFYQCIKETAQRENLKSGLASVRFRPAGVFGGVEKIGYIGDIGYVYPDNRVFYPELSFTNPAYLEGSFDFVLVNATKEGRLMYPPERDFCYPNSLENPKRAGHYQCNPHSAQFGFYITGETTMAKFGKPSKVAKCAAAELWIYRPPKRLQ